MSIPSLCQAWGDDRHTVAPDVDILSSVGIQNFWSEPQKRYHDIKFSPTLTVQGSMLKLSCYFSFLGHQNAQTSFPSHVAGSSPAARTERPKFDPERSCPAGSGCYSNPSLIGTSSGQSHLVLGSALDTQLGHVMT